GVLMILTARDLGEVGGLPVGWIVPCDPPMAQPPHPVLATDRVRHVGDPVAFVVAETRAAALDAAEAIVVEYEALPAAVDLATALDADAAP
ncbi:hypothetical protein ABTM75_19355, partial [Acinetobacter baumannii]